MVDATQAGVEAGRRGEFALVVGVARAGTGEALAEHGADVVVTDLDELDVHGALDPTGGGDGDGGRDPYPGRRRIDEEKP